MSLPYRECRTDGDDKDKGGTTTIIIPEPPKPPEPKPTGDTTIII